MEQARTAELQLVCSLSSLSPRMAHLQKKLLPPLRVSLSHDLSGELQVLNSAAAKLQGVKPSVKVWAEGAGVLRRFLPPDEGGVDKGWPDGFPLRGACRLHQCQRSDAGANATAAIVSA